jgi:hypothetical protein
MESTTVMKQTGKDLTKERKRRRRKTREKMGLMMQMNNGMAMKNNREVKLLTRETMVAIKKAENKKAKKIKFSIKKLEGGTVDVPGIMSAISFGTLKLSEPTVNAIKDMVSENMTEVSVVAFVPIFTPFVRITMMMFMK